MWTSLSKTARKQQKNLLPTPLPYYQTSHTPPPQMQPGKTKKHWILKMATETINLRYLICGSATRMLNCCGAAEGGDTDVRGVCGLWAPRPQVCCLTRKVWVWFRLHTSPNLIDLVWSGIQHMHLAGTKHLDQTENNRSLLGHFQAWCFQLCRNNYIITGPTCNSLICIFWFKVKSILPKRLTQI